MMTTTVAIDLSLRRGRRKLILQTILSGGAWFLLLFFASTLIFTSFEKLAHITVVNGNSMEPTYMSGDIIIAFKQEAYFVGESIVFQPAEVGASCPRCHIVHRVVEINEQGQYMTRGDNNSFNDQWWLDHSEILGAEHFYVKTGEVGLFLFSVELWLFILTVLLFLFVLATVWNWLTHRSDEDDNKKHPEDFPIDEDYYESLISASESPLKRARTLKIARYTPDVLGFSLVTISILVAVLGAAATSLTLNSSPLQVDQITAPIENPGTITPVGSGYTFDVTYTQPNGQQVCANIVVSTTSTTPVPWSATLNISSPPFTNPNSGSYQFNPNGQYRFAPGGPVNNEFTIQGTGQRGNVVAGTDRVFAVCL